MHTNQTFNALTIDNPEQLPLPPEIKKDLALFDLNKIQWNAFGLPAFHSTFCLTGDQLYFEKDNADNVKLRKEEFTGQIIISGVVASEKCEWVHFVTFEIGFCKGIVCTRTLTEFKSQSQDEYNAGYKKYCDNLEKARKIRESFWCRWIYRPYFHTLSWATVVVVFLIEFILKSLVFVVDKMLPIKLG